MECVLWEMQTKRSGFEVGKKTIDKTTAKRETDASIESDGVQSANERKQYAYILIANDGESERGGEASSGYRVGYWIGHDGVYEQTAYHWGTTNLIQRDKN